jgi:hypothetical protein
LIDLFYLTSVIPKEYIDNKNKNKKQKTKNKKQNTTLDERNPPPLTVSCAPSGDGGPTSYILQKENQKRKFKIKKISNVKQI